MSHHRIIMFWLIIFEFGLPRSDLEHKVTLEGHSFLSFLRFLVGRLHLDFTCLDPNDLGLVYSLSPSLSRLHTARGIVA